MGFKKDNIFFSVFAVRAALLRGQCFARGKLSIFPTVYQFPLDSFAYIHG